MPGHGPASSGLWRVPGRGAVVAKRLNRPPDHESTAHRPDGLGFWRREADALSSGALADLPGVAALTPLDVLEDEDGLTLFLPEVVRTPLPSTDVVKGLATWAGSPVATAEWMVDDQFGQRLDALERRGGWFHLARTAAADLADAVWERRRGLRATLARAPRVFTHGDLTPGNVVGLDPAGKVLLLDWASCGLGAFGHDLGYWWLSTSETLEEFVRAAEGVRGVSLDADDTLTAARATAVFTAFTRADWALRRVARGEGALAAKLRHPGVARHLRDVERVEKHAKALAGLAHPG